jgi:hypothetical protein
MAARVRPRKAASDARFRPWVLKFYDRIGFGPELFP